MVDRVDREKVITLLDDMRMFADLTVHEIVSPDNWNVYSELCDLIDFTKEAVLSLLKAQEPRVMTLEEALVDNNNSIEISPYVFVEIKGRNDIFIGSVHDDIYGDYHSNDIKVRVYRIWMSDSKTYPKADYMKTVRFWNRKPTEEQREAVKWDD